VSGATHLRGIVIAGALAALALALAFVTLSMNQTASKAADVTTTILPLKDRHPAASTTTATTATTTTATTKAAAKISATKPAVTKPKVVTKPKPKPVSPFLKEALAAGLPHSIAQGLAAAPVVVVELTTEEDPIAAEAAAEAQQGAKLGGAAYVPVSVDSDNTTVQALARLLEEVPDAPAALVYTRPGTLALTLTGFVDRTVIEQAVVSATPVPGAAGDSDSSTSSSNGAPTTSNPTTAGASA